MADKLVTNARQEWAEQFNFSGVMRGSSLPANAAIQERYSRALVKLAKQMSEQTKRELTKYFKGETAKEYFALDESVSSQARILTNAIKAKFSDMFAKRAKRMADQMVRQSQRASASATHVSLKELSGGLSIKTSAITPKMKEIMKASITENVSLIKSIPQQYFEAIEGAVMRSIVSGNGLQDLVPFIKQREGITIRRARFIARDQTRKVYAALGREQTKSAGLTQFEWVHTGRGKEPRELHVHLSGKIFSYDDPPVIDQKTGQRGFPAELPNCGCIERPILKFDAGEAKQ